VEIDGLLHHSSETAFESDRRRQNALVLDGWRVLRFTWAMLTDRPEDVIAAVRNALVRSWSGGDPTVRHTGRTTKM
jgi:very-short-patch-repair endonuclease